LFDDDVDTGEAEGVIVTGVKVAPVIVGATDTGEAVGFMVGGIVSAVGTSVYMVGVTVGVSVLMATGVSVSMVGADVLVVGADVCGVKVQAPSTVAM
jgi:hypothetical protein